MNNNNHNLIKVCRYFKGEKECPAEFTGSDKALIWFYESRWVDQTLEDSEVLKLHLIEYSEMPGLLFFESDDSTPITLKALLFNRYAKDYYARMSAVEDFKRWYKEIYIDLS